MKTLFIIVVLICSGSLVAQELATGYTPMPEHEYNELQIAFCNSSSDKKLPATYVIPESYFPTPGSQGNIGSCVGWTTGYALASFYFGIKYNTGKPTTTDQIMSPAFVYNEIRKCNCGPNCGSYIGDALNLLMNKGIVSWKSMPYENEQACSKPTEAHYKSAAKNKIAGWNRLIDKLNFNEYREHLSNDVPIVIGVPLGKDFSNYGYQKSANPFTCTQLSSGGHAMLIVGYDDTKRAFKIMNSWGKDWGVNGYIWVDYDCFKLMMSGSGGEAYVISKDYELDKKPSPEIKPSVNISADKFKPYGHWELISRGHYYIDYGLKIDKDVVDQVARVTYVYDHPSFPNKYVTVDKGPYFRTAYEGPYCLPNMLAVVYLKDGTSVQVQFEGCKILAQIEGSDDLDDEEYDEEYDDEYDEEYDDDYYYDEEYDDEDEYETYEVHPVVTATPIKDNPGYYNFDIRIRGVEHISEYIEKVVYDFNHPTFKNRFVDVLNPANGYKTGYTGWGCLSGLGVTIYFIDGSTDSYSIDMCDILGW